MRFNLFYILSLILIAINSFSDSFSFNTLNNHGSVGLINSPTARFYDASSYGVLFYSGDPDKKITLSAYPYDWLETSVFYSEVSCNDYKGSLKNFECGRSFKDKGFNIKLRIKEEGKFPALAIGLNDMAGTGFYSSEYIVASYGINNIDFHLGLGWGNLSNQRRKIKNPLIYANSNFADRSDGFNYKGGQPETSKYFAGKHASPFFGISYAYNNKLIFQIESDAVKTPGMLGYEDPKKSFSYGLKLNHSDKFVSSISFERGNTISLGFNFKNNPSTSNSEYKYESANTNLGNSKYEKLISNLEGNGLGVNKIIETKEFIGLELTQFKHSNIELIEEIIRQASLDSNIKKDIVNDYRTANLKVNNDLDALTPNSMLIYQRGGKRTFNTSNSLTFRPFLAARESFFNGALLIENNSEYIINDGFFFSSNLKYSLYDNFDELTIPPKDKYPAQVRSDIKNYLNNFSNGIFIGRAQFDYHRTLKQNHHLMMSAGILEEMFNGIGFEYLYFKQDSNYAFGFEIFDVTKRDYEMRFGTLDYKNVTGSANFYYRNYDIIPFDAKVSYGEYLAGDEGVTFELSRSFLNGTKFGVFASFTDVSSEQFGEGSFDKGIFFNIPIYGNFINSSWRPLTKDPGAKLNRKHTLHDLLIKFKPYNY